DMRLPDTVPLSSHRPPLLEEAPWTSLGRFGEVIVGTWHGSDDCRRLRRVHAVVQYCSAYSDIECVAGGNSAWLVPRETGTDKIGGCQIRCRCRVTGHHYSRKLHGRHWGDSGKSSSVRGMAAMIAGASAESTR